MINPNISPNMVKLISELEKAGFISDGYLVYQDEQEASVIDIFNKYGLTLTI